MSILINLKIQILHEHQTSRGRAFACWTSRVVLEEKNCVHKYRLSVLISYAG